MKNNLLDKKIKMEIQDRLIYVFKFRFDLIGFDYLKELIYMTTYRSKSINITDLIKLLSNKNNKSQGSILRSLEHLFNENRYLKKCAIPHTIKKFLIYYKMDDERVRLTK